MDNNPVYVTFEFKGNLKEEVSNVTLGIKGMRDESANTFKSLLSSSNEAFAAMSKNNQELAVSIQQDIESLRALGDIQDALNKSYENGTVSASDYAESKARLLVLETDMRSGIKESIQQLDESVEADKRQIGSIEEKKAALIDLESTYQKISQADREGSKGDNLLQQIKSLKIEINGLDSTYTSATTGSDNFSKGLQSLPGPLGAMTKGIMSATAASLAFLATPLGAVLGAIAAALALVSMWFKRTEEGENALAVASAAFSAVLNSVLDVASKVGKWLYDAFTNPKQALSDLVDFIKENLMNRLEGIIDMGKSIIKIFSKDWKNGLMDFGNAFLKIQTGIDDVGGKVSKFMDETLEKTNKAIALANRENDLEKQKRNFLVERAKLEANINELRDKAYDQKTPESVRLNALKEAMSLNDQLYNKEIEFAKEKFEIIKQTNELSDSNKKDLTAQAEAEAEISRLDAQRLSSRRMMLRMSNSLGNADKGLQNKISEYILNAELSQNAKRIAIMRDGKEKRIALIKQEYEEAIAEINKKEKELLSQPGVTKPQAEQISASANIDRDLEEQKFRKDNVDQEEKSSKELESIWADVNSRFATSLENRLSDIDKFYKEKAKKAREEGATEEQIQYLITLRNKEQLQVRNEDIVESGMRRLAVEEEIESKMLEVKQNNFITESLFSLKKNELEKKYAQKRLDILKKTITQEGSERHKQIEEEKKRLEGLISYLDENGKVLAGKVLKDAISGLSDIAGAIGGINDKLGETMKAVQGVLGVMSKMTEGDYIGAAVGLITTVVSSIAKSNQEAIAAAKKAEGDYWDAVNYKIERQIKLMKELKGVSSDQVNESLDKKRAELLDKIKNSDLELDNRKGGFVRYIDSIIDGIDKAKKRGDDFTVSFLESLAKKPDKVKGGVMFYYYDILKDLSEEQIIKLQEIGEIWNILPKEIQDYITALSEAVDKQEELNEYNKEKLTGTTSGAIADEIIKGLADGKRSVEDFAGDLEKMLRDAILRGIKAKSLDAPLQAWHDKLAEASKSGLTDDKIEELRKEYFDIINGAKDELLNAEKVTGVNFNDSSNIREGASKGLAAMSQDSADELNGRFTAMLIFQERINTSVENMHTLVRTGLSNQLGEIIENTAYCKRLEQIESGIKLLNTSLDTIIRGGLKMKI